VEKSFPARLPPSHLKELRTLSANKAAIGVVIPTRNSAATLESTLLSLTRQRGVAPRIIAIDSDSSDATRSILQEWGIEMLNVPSGNMYRAVNAGFAALDTTWVTWVNSDDLLYADGLARLVAAGEEDDAGLVYGNCDYCDRDGRFLFGFSAARREDLVALGASSILGFGQHAAIFRRSLWSELGGLKEEFRLASDLDFFLRMFTGGARLTRIGGPPVGAFRIHDAQLSKVRHDEMEAEKRAIGSRVRIPWSSRRIALWRWRLQNARSYVIRSLRKRALQGTDE
jgi:glycosyltransferase involved in cell wall biosynthesis